MTLIDTINSIIMVQQNIVKDITEIKESQKIISEDNGKMIQNIQSITDNIQTIENNLTTLVNSYEIVN
jgi:predicted PurR-regulated permease PerM